MSDRSKLAKLGCRLLLVLGLASGCGDNILARRAAPFGDAGALDADGGPGDGAPDTSDVAGDGPADVAGGDDSATVDAGDAPADRGTGADLADAGDSSTTDVAADGPARDGDADDGDADDGGGTDAPDGASDATAPPACVISGPDLSVMHPILNGVPVAEGGDRVSADGTPYQVAFEVTTSLADNQIVELTVHDVATPSLVTTYMSPVANGRARFPGVALPVDGLYEVAARCLGKDGAVGLSGPEKYPVDTTPPVFTVTEPQTGEFIPPSGLTDGTFPVCGSTTSPDAVDLDPALGPRSANGCIAAGGSPMCFPVPSGMAGCLPVACPGDAPFDVIVTLGDIAGNLQRTVISNVSCFSTLPTVLIVSPVSDGPAFTDPSKHLLAATAPQAFRDNASAPGAQTDVVACANRAGTIKLFVGHKGDATLAGIGSPVGTRQALASDHCPASFLYAVTFAGVTLPESTEAADTSLLKATELRADLVDLSVTKNSSPLVDLWVDSVAPVLLITAPTDICNSYHQSSDIYTSSETVTSTAPNVDLTLTNSASTQNFESSTFTSLTFPFVVFTQGQTSLRGVALDDAGNSSLLQPNPCVVTVGPGPTP